MYRVPTPTDSPRASGKAPPTIDLLTDDQLRARRIRRWLRMVFILGLGFAGWHYRDRNEWSQVRNKAESLWADAVLSFHQAFPESATPKLKKGGSPPQPGVPKGGTVSPVGRSERLRQPGASPHPAPLPEAPPAPRAIEVKEDAS